MERLVTYKNIVKLFDYIFYRLYKFYKKRDTLPESYASKIVSILQSFLFIDIYFTTSLFIDLPKLNKYYGIPLGIIFMVINWFRYERNLDFKKFESQFEGETEAQRKKWGRLIVLGIILFISFPIIIGILKT